ncbi:MAG TPA: hypothetical protein VKS44_01285 [Candidatus Acidoferrales bacterium]|nr:hypothetical protein [Candidatus Acidoferrales bacterium]
MKSLRTALGMLAIVLALPGAYGQNDNGQDKGQTATNDKAAHELTARPEEPGVPLKILVVISEFVGSKKTSSLPYTLYTVSQGPAKPYSGPRNSLRYGVKVPIPAGSHDFNYQNVGTNIDYGAYERAGGDYQLVFTIDRSWVGMPDDEKESALQTNTGAAVRTTGGGADTSDDRTPRPLMPSFRDNFSIVLRNGQTVEGASAVDPVTGHVLKVDVTLTVLK